MDAAGQLYGKRLPQIIRFLFQSAAETTQGAAEAISNGVIPENLVACFAMHVWPGVAEGVAATTDGALMASSDVYRINIRGRSAHCAQSHNGADALQTAVRIAAKLPEIRDGAVDKKTILFCGSIHSGNSHNIVPDEASLWGTLRTFSVQDQENLKMRLEKETKEAAQIYGTQAAISWHGGCPAVINNAQLIFELQKCIPNLCTTAQPTLAAEDFALYQQYAPGVMLWLGTGDTPPLHNSAFYVPEAILPKGISMWVEIASHNWMGAVHDERT
jgi:hippurate hydrolase